MSFDVRSILFSPPFVLHLLFLASLLTYTSLASSFRDPPVFIIESFVDRESERLKRVVGVKLDNASRDGVLDQMSLESFAFAFLHST